MPQQASQSSSTPPLPPGYTLDAPTQAAPSVPPLPQGYTLDQQQGADKSGLGMDGAPLTDRTVPNARIRNMTVDPTKDVHSGGQAFYEGAKTGLELGSIPATIGQPLWSVVRGALGAALGSAGGKTLAKAAGAGDFGQEVAGDVGGLAGGTLSAGAGSDSRISRSAAAIAKPGMTAVEDLPVVGSVIKGVKAAKNVSGDLADIWAKKPVYPGASEPATPPREMLQAGALAKAVQSPTDPAAGLAKIPAADPALSKARSLFEGSSSPSDPAAALQTVKSGTVAGAMKDPGAPLPATPDPALLKARTLFEGTTSPQDPAVGLGTIKQSAAGSIVDSMKAQPSADVAPGFQRGSLQGLLDKSLGARQLDPKVPLRQQLDVKPASTSGSSSGIPEGHTPAESSALKSYKYDSGAQEFHIRGNGGDPTYVYGDVSPDDAQAFTDAPSKGQAWGAMKRNPLVAKIIGGKRVAVKVAQ